MAKTTLAILSIKLSFLLMNDNIILVVEAPHFYAGATYEKIDGRWECTGAAPILKWLIGMSPQKAAIYIQRKGWIIHWQH